MDVKLCYERVNIANDQGYTQPSLLVILRVNLVENKNIFKI